MKNLEKVYFQDLTPEIIKERFQSIRDDMSFEKLVTKRDEEQFLLPNELDI